MKKAALRTSSTAAAALVLSLACVALALRVYAIGDKSIWLDEAWSWRAANLSLADMVDWSAADRHPPLYYGVLHFIVRMFGDSEATLRLPSACASATTVGLLAYVGWRGGGWLLALVAGGLLALHPTHIEFAQEARMYPLMGLLVLSATIALAALIDRPSIWRATMYALLAVAMLYTHYSAVLVLGLHALLLASFSPTRWRSEGRTALALGLGAIFIALIAFAPWYGHFVDSAREGVGHLPDPSWRLADLVWSSMFGLQHAEDLWLAVALPLAAFGAYGVWKRASDPYVVCVAAIALVPLIQLAVSWLRTPVLDARQASPFIAGYAFVTAVGLVELGQYVADLCSRQALARPVTLVAGVCLGVVLFAAVVDWYDSGPREDWREAARIVDERGGTALVWRGYVDVPLSYYSRASAVQSPPGRPAPSVTNPRTLVLSHATPSETDEILRDLTGVLTGEPIVLSGIVVYPLTAR